MKTCGVLGCESRAAVRVVPQYGRPVLRCAPHGDETLAVWSFFDNRGMTGSRLEKLA